MPAVTVDDVLSLPRIPAADLAAVDRPVRSVTTAPRGFEGEGFPVRRAFAGVDLADLDPFVHLDQMGEVEYAPGEPKGTPWHPHRGFETVTYMIDGEMAHQDSNGGGGLITNGDTQWMTAGSGILHIETPPETLVISGGLFHGFQLWVNLPSDKKWSPPRYQDIRGAKVGAAGLDRRRCAGPGDRRLAAGSRPGRPRLDVHTDHAGPRDPAAGRRADPAVAARLQRAGLRARRLRHRGLRDGARPLRAGQLAVLGAGDSVTVRADAAQESRSPELDVLVLGGRPIREPVAWYGPFVMNNESELRQAFADFQAGKLGTIPAAH